MSRLGGGQLDTHTDTHRHIIRDRGITPVGMLSRLGGGQLDIDTHTNAIAKLIHRHTNLLINEI